VLPVVERAKVIPPLARQINARVPRDVPVAIHKLKQATLNFYIGRPIEYLDTEDQVVGWVRQAGPGVLVMSRDKLDEIERKRGRLEVAEVARAAGLDYSRGRWLELVALSRPGTPRIPN
jgi:hypothetical protein